MPDRIEARVAAILTERELVINKGEQDGVSVGMRFAILNRKGADIKDPDTGEPLGSVEVDKAIVKIVRMQDRLAVGRTFRTHRSGGFGVAALLGNLQARPETLRIQGATYKEELNDADSYVSVGDMAVQIVGDEYVQDSSE